MADSKLYSRKEISKILAKASEIQSSGSLHHDPDGLTEEELFHIAEEVGISKNALKEALMNHDNTDSDGSFSWLKGTSSIQQRLMVDGEISDKQWEEIVLEIRKLTGGIGRVSKVGTSFEWEQRKKEIGYKHISLTPDSGHTKIQFVDNWNGLKIMSTVFSFLAGFVITAIALDGMNVSDISALLMAFSGGIVTLPLGRVFLRSYFAKQKQQMKSLFSNISKKLGPTSPHIFIEDEASAEKANLASTKSGIKS